MIVLFNDICSSLVHYLCIILGRAYRGLTGGFLLLSVTISVSPSVCFNLVLISFNSDFYVSKILHL